MIESEAGIVRALYYDNNGKPSGSSDTLTSKADYGSLGCKQLSEELNVAKVPLRRLVRVLAGNGRTRIIDTHLLRDGYSDLIRIPGSQNYFQRHVVRCSSAQHLYNGLAHPGLSASPMSLEPWTIFLSRRHPCYPENKEIDHATVIQLCVGDHLDGIMVGFHYADISHSRPWTQPEDATHFFGGDKSELRRLNPGDKIVKVELSRYNDWACFQGIRITLSSGVAWGELNLDDDDGCENVLVLEPTSGERVVGLCGLTGRDGWIREFGIVTIERSIDIPDLVYDMKELVRVHWPKADVETFEESEKKDWDEEALDIQATNAETLHEKINEAADIDADIAIPGSTFCLRKVTPRTGPMRAVFIRQEQQPPRVHYPGCVSWHILFDRNVASENPPAATTKIDLRVGATFDGIIVDQTDGSRTTSRPRSNLINDSWNPLHLAGHASQAFDLPIGVEILKVELCKRSEWSYGVDGIRVTLDTSERYGELNAQPGERAMVLEPGEGEKVVGFYGLSQKGRGYVQHFGLLTLAAEAGELPATIYDLPEFQRQRQPADVSDQYTC